MSIIKVSKRTVGPTLAKSDDKPEPITVPVTDNCEVGQVGGGFGIGCSGTNWDFYAKCDSPRSCELGGSASYDC